MNTGPGILFNSCSDFGFPGLIQTDDLRQKRRKSKLRHFSIAFSGSKQRAFLTASQCCNRWAQPSTHINLLRNLRMSPTDIKGGKKSYINQIKHRETLQIYTTGKLVFLTNTRQNNLPWSTVIGKKKPLTFCFTKLIIYSQPVTSSPAVSTDTLFKPVLCFTFLHVFLNEKISDLKKKCCIKVSLQSTV